MPTFFTSFMPPSAVSGLTVEADIVASAVRLSWDVTAIADVDFGGYRVYRSTDGVTYTEIALLGNTTDVEYDDFSAPLNVALFYRVTQSNLDFESDPVEATVMLESLAWWVVTPGDTSLTFAVTRVRGAVLRSPKVQDEFSPVGRTTRLVVGDVVQTEEGDLRFLVMPDQPEMVALLKAIQARMEGTVTLKSPDGGVHQVQFRDMTRSFTNVNGMQEISIPFVGAG